MGLRSSKLSVSKVHCLDIDDMNNALTIRPTSGSTLFATDGSECTQQHVLQDKASELNEDQSLLRSELTAACFDDKDCQTSLLPDNMDEIYKQVKDTDYRILSS
jgi:hypothetical protein